MGKYHAPQNIRSNVANAASHQAYPLKPTISWYAICGGSGTKHRSTELNDLENRKWLGLSRILSSPCERHPLQIAPLHISKFMVPPYAGIEYHVDTLARALMPKVGVTVLAGKVRRQDYDKPYKLYLVNSYGQIDAVHLTPG